MVKAVDLLRQGRHEELWQMCCGFLGLTLEGFMNIQKRLLLEQLELLSRSQLGAKVMQGANPRTVEEFRQQVPLTTYKDYCPELLEKKEDLLPVKPEFWVHSSGWSGDYPCKWVPVTPKFAHELSVILYGIGMLSCCDDWGDTSRIPNNLNILYSVAGRPYVSGAFADLLKMQTPLDYMPSQEASESMPFDERIKIGFQQALSQGLDYFFGLSLVLVTVGERFRQSSQKVDIRPYLVRPRALWRLARGKLRSRMAGRPMLPKDLWSVRGIIGSGLDSHVYKGKIAELWGRPPLDLYSGTEGGVIATQTWDYEGLTFVPNLNFLEFIPEDELVKWQMDSSYQMKTLLLDEVRAGENYEIVLTSLHGGALVRYRPGDMVRITSLRNEKLGIDIPQMVFERRVDSYLDFFAVRLTEKTIWQAIEDTGIAYEDWMAYKEPGELTLNLLIELRDGYDGNEEEIAAATYSRLVERDNGGFNTPSADNNLISMADFRVNVNLLPKGTFSGYIAKKQAEGADLAHLKPPHINPSDEVLSLLLSDTEEIIEVSKTGSRVETAVAVENGTDADKAAV
jgi:hypothetical protein